MSERHCGHVRARLRIYFLENKDGMGMCARAFHLRESNDFPPFAIQRKLAADHT